MTKMTHTSFAKPQCVRPDPACKRIAVIGDRNNKLTVAMMLAFQHLPQFDKVGCTSPVHAREMIRRGAADCVLASHTDPDYRHNYTGMDVMDTLALHAPAFVYGQWEKGGVTSGRTSLASMPAGIVCPVDARHHLSALHGAAPVTFVGDDVAAVKQARRLARARDDDYGFVAAEFTTMHHGADAALYRLCGSTLRVYSVLREPA